jgi:hypothetical protein
VQRSDLHVEQRRHQERLAGDLQRDRVDPVRVGGDRAAGSGDPLRGVGARRVAAEEQTCERLVAEHPRQRGVCDGRHRPPLAVDAARQRADQRRLRVRRRLAVVAQVPAGEREQDVLEPAARAEQRHALAPRPPDRLHHRLVVAVRAAGRDPQPVAELLDRLLRRRPPRVDAVRQLRERRVERAMGDVPRVVVAQDGDLRHAFEDVRGEPDRTSRRLCADARQRASWPPSVAHVMPPRVEEIAYDMSRTALADQASSVAGIRSRTATLVAAQALVASFLGDVATDGGALDPWGWAAIGALTVGLLLATLIVAPWKMRFSLDVHEIYPDLRAVADEEAGAITLAWLVTVSYLHQERFLWNRRATRRLDRLSAALGIVTTVQSLLWIVAIGVR